VDVFHEVAQHKHRELLLALGGMHVRQQAIVLHNLCRGTGALGAVLGVRFGRTDGHVSVVPWARSRDVLLQLVFALIEVEAQGGQIITAHELLNRGSGLWREEGAGHVPGDPVPLGAPGLYISTRGAEAYGRSEECCDADGHHRGAHLVLPAS
jgi:hypothetical protein